jgi:hypothetical protein
VAENQERAVDARRRWTYEQETFVRMLRSNGKLAREERRVYSVLPTAKGIDKQLLTVDGKYERKGKYLAYTKAGHRDKEMDIDAELANEMAGDMFHHSSRDGIESDQFPLTAERQRGHKFTLAGREKFRGRDVWRINFEPRERDEIGWAGEALIDVEEYQPVQVITHMSRGIPMAVRLLLGIDLQHAGFKVQYRKLDDRVWFPERYSGEFNLKVLFLYRRKIGVAMHNTGFQRTDVQSTIDYVGLTRERESHLVDGRAPNLDPIEIR